MSQTELIAICVAAVAVVVAVVGLVLASRGGGSKGELEGKVDNLERLLNGLGDQQLQATAATQASLNAVSRNVEQAGVRVDSMRRDVTEQLAKDSQAMTQQLQGNTNALNAQLTNNTKAMNEQLGLIRQDNQRQLDEIRATVDERLTKTLNDRLSVSFKQINDNLEAVYKGLGDMQSLATGVGDLKKTLSNVKTRGILGEVQLGAILREILTPSQYEENVATKPGSSERVEFAVKLPVEEGEPILLPIDAKFPGDLYSQLCDALEAGDPDQVKALRKQLEDRIKSESKDISTKYISVPETTNFAIMFLPFEGLYAEVVNMPGLVERLQRDWQVCVAGPSTMSAILGSLQMSYQTFALQRQTDEVLKVLQAVKAELPVYQKELERAKKQIDRASATVEGIITTRTNVMQRKLKTISDGLAGDDATNVLDGADAFDADEGVLGPSHMRED